MSIAHVSRPSAPVRATVELPGDKSVSHRRALLTLFVDGTVRLRHYATGDDGAATLDCLRRLGKSVSDNGGEVVIDGPAGCRSAELECRNSGTTARMLMGILAGHPGEWVLTGDASLSGRPMERVALPLRLMGAQIELTDGRLPARITGRPLHGIDYESPVASAQLKSAVLLAGLTADGVTRYREPAITRDHTERLLGIGIDYVDWLTVNPRQIRMTAETLSGTVPADPSSAAFWIAIALIVPGSQVVLPRLLANPHRLAFVSLLRRCGAGISLYDIAQDGGEDVATIEAKYAVLSALEVRHPDTAKMIDEIPALAAAATQAAGHSAFFDAAELRVKESDRLRLITENLRRMGAESGAWEDGFDLHGPVPLRGARIRTDGDHRIAMAFAAAGLVAEGRTDIDDAECVSVSYPNFWKDLSAAAPGSVEVV